MVLIYFENPVICIDIVLSWRSTWQPTVVSLPGEFQEQRSLVGYSPWDHKELDMTEWLTLLLSEILACQAKCHLQASRKHAWHVSWQPNLSTEKLKPSSKQVSVSMWDGSSHWWQKLCNLNQMIIQWPSTNVTKKVKTRHHYQIQNLITCVQLEIKPLHPLC